MLQGLKSIDGGSTCWLTPLGPVKLHILFSTAANVLILTFQHKRSLSARAVTRLLSYVSDPQLKGVLAHQTCLARSLRTFLTLLPIKMTADHDQEKKSVHVSYAVQVASHMLLFIAGRYFKNQKRSSNHGPHACVRAFVRE
jgi:hypothetical protein